MARKREKQKTVTKEKLKSQMMVCIFQIYAPVAPSAAVDSKYSNLNLDFYQNNLNPDTNQIGLNAISLIWINQIL